MKISSITFFCLLFISIPIAAQESLESKYSKEKIQELSPEGVTIIEIKIYDNEITISFTAKNNKQVADFMRKLSMSSLGDPNLRSIRKKRMPMVLPMLRRSSKSKQTLIRISGINQLILSLMHKKNVSK